MWFPFQWQAIFRHIPCSGAQESVTYGWLDKPFVPFIYSHDIPIRRCFHDHSNQFTSVVYSLEIRVLMYESPIKTCFTLEPQVSHCFQYIIDPFIFP